MLISTFTMASFPYTTADDCIIHLAWLDTMPVQVVLNAYDATKREWVEWVFALDLLAQGLVTVAPSWAGAGMVHVQSHDMERAFIALSSFPEGTATLSLPWDVLSRFVGDCIGAMTDEGEAKTLGLLVDTFLRELNLESF